MCNLLNKFDAIQVQADTRISEEDRHVCEIHQQAYDQAREDLRSLAEQLEALEQAQEKTLSAVVEDYYTDGYLNPIKSEKIYDQLDRTHKTFIHFVIAYFQKRYKVSIDEDKVKDALLPPKPKHDWRWTQAAADAYTNSLRTLKLSYQDIVEQIFLQLGGYSFQEKAVKELKDAAHEAAWSNYGHSKSYEQKKTVIRKPLNN